MSKSQNSEKGEKKKDNGQFKPGNTIGYNTRFQPGHSLSTKYSEEYPKKMVEYFLSDNHSFPTFAGFGASIGVLIETLERWCEKHPQFKSCYALCKQIQEDKLCNGGLNRTYDASLVKFLLTNNHGMKDKVEQDINGNVNGNINGSASINVNISFFDEE